MDRHGDCTEQSGSEVGQVNRHLRQSYDANLKIMVVDAAEASNNCQPAKKYGVTECKVQRPCNELATCPGCTQPSPGNSWDWLQQQTLLPF